MANLTRAQMAALLPDNTTGDISAKDMRDIVNSVLTLAENFPVDGKMELVGDNPEFAMKMNSAGDMASMRVESAGILVVEMLYSESLQTFALYLKDKTTGDVLTDFILMSDGTCQVAGETLISEQWYINKQFYEYFKMPTSRTISQDTYIEVARLDINQAPSGIMEYGLSMTFNYDTTGRSAMFRFSTDNGSNWSYWNKETKDVTDDNIFYYAYPSENSTEQDINLIIEAKCESASDTLVVKYLNITVDRKSDY